MNWYRKMAFSPDLNKLCIIVRGVSGSGKSTLAKELGAEGEIYSTDDFFSKDGDYAFNPKMLGKAHEWNQERVWDAMRKGVSPIVVDNTNRQLWEMKAYAAMAKEYGYEVEFAEPNWSPELKTPEGKWNVDFLRGKNTHGVDDATLQRMVDSYDYDPTVEGVLKSKAPWEK